MNRSVSSKFLLILTGIAASACGLLGLGGSKGGDQGELVGVPGREGWGNYSSLRHGAYSGWNISYGSGR
jgi:hypothetical protein